MQDSIFFECSKGILLADSRLDMNNCEISEGKRDGICVYSGKLVLEESIIKGNRNNGLSIIREEN